MMRIYAAYDIPAEQFSAPFVARTDAVAQRVFGHYLKAQGAVKPEEIAEYELYYIGNFDDDCGVIRDVPAVAVRVGLASDITMDKEDF